MKLLFAIAVAAASLTACGKPATDSAARKAIEISQAQLKPVEDAAVNAIQQLGADIERKEAERKAKIAADREARAPKAYRWKDANGQWHLSDSPPENAAQVETIRLK